jgi:hypothetical protein
MPILRRQFRPACRFAPYYDPQRALRLGRKALGLTEAWGERGEKLPLAEERDDLRRARFNLLLLMALATGQSSDTSDSVRNALDLIDQAERIETPTVGSSALRNSFLARLGKSAAARGQERRTATKERLPPMAADDRWCVIRCC